MIIRRSILYGFIFGLSFPIGALVIDLLINDFPFNFSGIKQAHQHNYLHWIIDSAPFVLGLMGFFIGQQKHKLKEYAESLEKTIDLRTLALNKSLVQAEQSSQAKTEFLSHMSHELRTPLNAIFGFTQLLQLDDLNEEQQDSVNEIYIASQYLIELINQLLNLGQIESGNIKVLIENVFFSTIYNDCIALIQPLANQRNISIINEMDTNIDWLIAVDKFRLKEILLNLLSNAVKYNKESGRVIVTVEQREAYRLRISITDTGKGLTVEQQKRLFQSFERLDAEKLGIDGVGIGLVITKQLLELMDGLIGVTSKVGIGSTFWMEINLAKK